MRQISFATSLIFSLFVTANAFGQGFWYLPPGADDFNFRYGWDLGNGFGYGVGYGFGYGPSETPLAAAESAYNDLARLQQLTRSPQSQPAFSGGEVYRDRMESVQKQKTAAELKKQHELKLQQVKTERAARERYLEFRSHAPIPASLSGLSAMEFDNATGEVHWPEVLTRKSFAGQRAEIETLLKSRVQAGTGNETGPRIIRKTESLQQELRQQIRGIPAKEYLEGRNFLNRLVFEAQLPVS